MKPQQMFLALFVTFLFGLMIVFFASVTRPTKAEKFVGSFTKGSCKHTDTSLNCVEYIRNTTPTLIKFNVHSTHAILGRNLTSQLKGIHVPNIKSTDKCEQKVAVEARDFATRILASAVKIDLTNIARAKRFRVLADVVVDGKNLAEILVAHSYAYYYDDKPKPSPACPSNTADVRSYTQES